MSSLISSLGFHPTPNKRSCWLDYWQMHVYKHGFRVYNRKSTCAGILSSNEMGVFTQQYKANGKILQTFVEVWIYDRFNSGYLVIPSTLLQCGIEFRYNLISGWETRNPRIESPIYSDYGVYNLAVVHT